MGRHACLTVIERGAVKRTEAEENRIPACETRPGWPRNKASPGPRKRGHFTRELDAKQVHIVSPTLAAKQGHI